MLLPALLLSLAPGEVRLPESEAARALASVGPQTAPADLGPGLLDLHPWLVEPEAGPPEAVHGTWARWIAAEAAAGVPDPTRRAGLLLVAARQSRHEEAWAHLGALVSDPGRAAAVLPILLPGVPPGTPAAEGGLPVALPDGVLLRPAPPPAPPGDPAGSLRPRHMEVRGLRVGAAVVNLRVALEPSGVQVDVEHVDGGPARLRVLLPEPEGQEIRVEYVDWMRQDTHRAPLLVELSPEDEEPHTLWGRFLPRRTPLPALPAGALPRGLERAGLFLACPPGGPLEAEARAFAGALGELYGFPTGVLPPGAPAPAPDAEALLVRLTGGEDGRRLLHELARRVERHRLGGPGRR